MMSVERVAHSARVEKAFQRLPSQAAAYADQFRVERQGDLIEELYGHGEAAYQRSIEDKQSRHPEAIVLSHSSYYWDVTVRAARAGIAGVKAHPELEEDDYFAAVRTVENAPVLPREKRHIQTSLSVVALTRPELRLVVSRYFQLAAEDWLLERDEEEFVKRMRDSESARGDK